MNTQELLELLESGNVTVHTPETFQFKEVFNEMDTSMNPGMREFVSLDNPYVTMTFDTDFHDSGEPYCSVFATDETGDHMLLTEDERGNVVGHMNEVEYFINRNFDEGFYETQEAESKIDGWQDLVSPVDEDYERYIEQLALEENERMESEESWADDILSIDEEPPTLEELNEMNPPEEDLSNLSFEEQAEWIAEELQPGGKIDRFIEELKLGEKPSAQEKFELAGNDRNVSDTTKEYFKPSPEKQPYFDIMKTGFIPFEIREGYHGKDAAPDDIKISKEVINDIRMNVDPDFGYIAGVDTSKFHTRNEDGETKNVSIIPMTYEDLKPYMTETNLFEEKDVVSVRAIKEYGDRISVQGERFAVNNLVTFEVKLKNQEVHRSTMVIDDTGTALARMDFLATDLYHSFHIDTNNPYIGGDDLRLIHFEKLDRTNVENPGHFKCMDGKDENFRENFKKEIEDRIPGFLQDYCDRYGESLESGKFDVIDRKDYMEMRLDDISSAHKSLHNMTNITELYRESLEAKAYAANKRAGELDNEINLIDTERKKVSPDSEEYKTLSDKIENCKEKWADSYSEYKDLKQKYEEFSKDSAPIRDTYIDLNRQYEYLSKEYEQHFNNLDSNGISYEKPGIERTPQEQFSRLCDITVLRNDQVPTYLSVDAKDIISEKADVIRLAGEGLQDIVNAYNADIENPIEQIQFLGDERDPESISESNLYTASGYEIQAHSMTTDINRYLANNPEKNMETSKDTAIGEPHRPYIENSGHVDETNSKLYAGEKAEGSDKTRQEIREDFIDKAIYDGNSPESVTLTDRSTSEGMTDTGLYHEMEAMKQTIDAHPGEKVSDIDGFREEVLERKEQLDEQIPKPDIEEFGRTDSTDQEENPNHTDTTDKSEIRPDVEKQPDEAETADVSADDVEKQDIERTQPEGFVPDMDNHEEEKDAADRESEQNDIEKKDEEADETERSERENDKIEQEDIDGITSEVDKDSDSIEQKPEDKQEPDNIEKDETDTKESDDVEKEEQDDADAKESDDIEQAELDEIDPREPDKMEKEDDADSKEPDDIENDETDAKESDDIEKEEQKDADVKESDDTEQAEPDEIDTREPDKTEKEDDADSKEPDDIESTEADTEKSEDVKKEEPDEPEAVDKEASIESAGASENHSDMFENSLERNQTAEEGQKEQDAISEQTDIETETENDKSDAAVLENSMDMLEDFVEPEEFEEQDNAAGENAVESEEENITMADRIESAVNGEEELDTVLEQVADDIMDGVEPEEAMSAILEGVSSAIEHGADAESVGDVIYEVSNMFGDSPIETMDTMLDTMAEHGIDSNMLEAVQEHVAEIYDSIETPFEDTAYGELDGVEFTEEDTVDSISGEADLDITYGTLDMFDSMMETADFDMIETDMQFVDHAEDMQDDFESQGFPNDIAADVSANMYEQMASDYDNGMDVFDDTYLQQLESQSLDSVQSMMGNSSDVNFEMDHVENGFETNPMEQQFGQDVQNIDYAPNDVDMNQMQQANMDYFNDFDNGFPLE